MRENRRIDNKSGECEWRVERALKKMIVGVHCRHKHSYTKKTTKTTKTTNTTNTTNTNQSYIIGYFRKVRQHPAGQV